MHSLAQSNKWCVQHGAFCNQDWNAILHGIAAKTPAAGQPLEFRSIRLWNQSRMAERADKHVVEEIREGTGHRFFILWEPGHGWSRAHL